MGTGDSYGGHEVAVLVKSLAISTAKLWEELFERMGRLEAAHVELRNLVTRIERALPDDADELRAALVALGEPVPPSAPSPSMEEGAERSKAEDRAQRGTPARRSSPAHVAGSGTGMSDRIGGRCEEDATRSLPPVWTPTPLVHVPHRGASTAPPRPVPSEGFPPRGDSESFGASTAAPPAPHPVTLAVPPPPAGYVVFRVPSRLDGVSGSAGRGTPCAPALGTAAPTRVIEGSRSAPPVLHGEIDAAGASAPAIAPNFSARTGRRRR